MDNIVNTQALNHAHELESWEQVQKKKAASPSPIAHATPEPVTSNAFTNLMPQVTDGATASDSDEQIEDFPNDPMGPPEEGLLIKKTEKKKGRPKKGEKPVIPAHTIYNTRSRVSVSEAIATAASKSNTPFKVDDARLRNSPMHRLESWADHCG